MFWSVLHTVWRVISKVKRSWSLNSLESRPYSKTKASSYKIKSKTNTWGLMTVTKTSPSRSRCALRPRQQRLWMAQRHNLVWLLRWLGSQTSKHTPCRRWYRYRYRWYRWGRRRWVRTQLRGDVRCAQRTSAAWLWSVRNLSRHAAASLSPAWAVWRECQGGEEYVTYS